MRAGLFALALCAGCTIDFDRYHSATSTLDAGAASDAGPALDRGAPDPFDAQVTMDLPAPTDTHTPPVDTPAPVDRPVTVSCPLPHLAVTVENLSGSGGGRLLRFQLDASYTRCPDVTLPLAQPMALAYVPTRGLVIAGGDGVVTVDPVTGRITDMIPLGESTYPLEVVPLQTGSDWGYLVAWRNPGSSNEEIQQVFRFGPAGRLSPDWSSAQIGQFNRGIARHPFDPTHYIVLRSDFPTRDVTPSTTSPHPRADLTGDTRNNLLRVHTVVPSSGRGRMTWPIAYGIYVSNPTSTTIPVPYGNLETASCGSVSCMTYLRAAAHPTSDFEAFGLCEGATFSQRQIHRVGGGETPACLVFDASTLGAQWRVSNLTVVTGF
ncbi:MAG: hypothetical protein R3A52_32070 [Polyangiales bacterium]